MRRRDETSVVPFGSRTGSTSNSHGEVPVGMLVAEQDAAGLEAADLAEKAASIVDTRARSHPERRA